MAQAAAENLVPTVLELGGKSPALLRADADLGDSARSIVAGKLLNAGQTCVAPDYALVPRAALPREQNSAYIKKIFQPKLYSGNIRSTG